MRGSTVAVRERQGVYVDDFRDAAPVLDVGCGRGEFLVACARPASRRAASTPTRTWPRTRAARASTSSRQTPSRRSSALADGSLGGIFMAQVVEHLPPATLVRAARARRREASARGRARGGDDQSAVAARPAQLLRRPHARQPLVPETLVLLAEQAGFRDVETRFANPPDEQLAIPDDPLIAGNVRRLNALLFAPLDYAIVARR